MRYFLYPPAIVHLLHVNLRFFNKKKRILSFSHMQCLLRRIYLIIKNNIIRKSTKTKHCYWTLAISRTGVFVLHILICWPLPNLCDRWAGKRAPISPLPFVESNHVVRVQHHLRFLWTSVRKPHTLIKAIRNLESNERNSSEKVRKFIYFNPVISYFRIEIGYLPTVEIF